MKKCLCIIFLLSVIFTVSAKDKRLSIAVFDFDIPGVEKTTKVTVSGKNFNGKITAKESVSTSLLTDKFITEIVKSNRLKVVERSKIEEILKEGDLAASGLADPSKCVKAGKLLGAKLLLFGTLNNIETTVKEKPVPYTSRIIRTGIVTLHANIRIVDAESGQIRAAHSANVDYEVNIDTSKVTNKHLIAAQEELVSKLTYLVLDEIFPLKLVHVASNQVYINQGANNNMKVGTEYTVFHPGEAIIDPDTGMYLGTTETEAGKVKISRVTAKMSFASIVSTLPNEKFMKGDVCRFIKQTATNSDKSQQLETSVDDIFK